MKTIWIITAMKEEADLIIKEYKLQKVLSKWTLSIYEWFLKNKKIILLLAGIWKIQASFSTTYLLENYKIDLLINIWIAGNISKDKINIWDVVLPNNFIQHDMYLPFEWEHLDYAKKAIKIKTSNIENKTNFKIFNNLTCLTWDQFIDNNETIKYLKEKFNWDIVEMEAFAILSVARNYDLLDKFIVIKWISDWANNEAIDDHMTNLEIAMQNSIIVLEEIINNF